jgi:hypothetical protein
MSIICNSCGRTVRSNLYRQHLYYEHGISREENGPDLSKVSGKKGRRARASVITAALSDHSESAPRIMRRDVVVDEAGEHGSREIVSHSVNVLLAPTKEQREILDAIFQAPEFCMYLFLTRWPRITSRADAEAFLYKHRHDIDNYLPEIYKRELIHVLADFMLEWSVRLPERIGIDFECTIVRTATDVVARILGLGDVRVMMHGAKGTLPSTSLQVQAMVVIDRDHYRLDFAYQEKKAVLRRGRVHQVPSLTNSGKSIFPALTLRGDGVKKPKKVTLAHAGRIQPALPSMPLDRPGRVFTGTCPLCGAIVGRGGMLAHKRNAHGESMFQPSPCQPPSGGRMWVALYQGGAPGLGKGKS